MKILLKVTLMLLLIPVVAFASNGYWESMVWDQDNWYVSAGTISGNVISSITGQTTNVVGATITIVENGQTVNSGADGTFTFSDVPVGEYTVQIEMPGFETVKLEDVQVTEEQTTQLATSEITFSDWWDVNGDGKIGLEEAIRALQVVSGIRAE